MAQLSSVNDKLIKGENRRLLTNSCSCSGAVYIDQYCNPLSEISLKDIHAQIDSIVELVCKTLRGINSRHPSLAFKAGMELFWIKLFLQKETSSDWLLGNSAVCAHYVTKKAINDTTTCSPVLCET